MDRRYSPITDLYGVTPPDEPPEHKSRIWVFVALVLAGLFVFESIRPVTRLRPDPPPDLVGARLSSDEAAYHEQERMAQACWDYATLSLQKTYPFGQALPEAPPPVFSYRARNAPAIRILCWQRLRHVWTQPETWVQSYEWDTNWVNKAWSLLLTSVRNNSFFQHLFE